MGTPERIVLIVMTVVFLYSKRCQVSLTNDDIWSPKSEIRSFYSDIRSFSDIDSSQLLDAKLLMSRYKQNELKKLLIATWDAALNNKTLNEEQDYFNLKPFPISQEALDLMKKKLSLCEVSKDMNSKYIAKNCVSSKQVTSVKIKNLNIMPLHPAVPPSEVVCKHTAHDGGLYLKKEPVPPAAFYNESTSVLWRNECWTYSKRMKDYHELMIEVHRANMIEYATMGSNKVRTLSNAKGFLQCVEGQELPHLAEEDPMKGAQEDSTLPKFRPVNQHLRIYSISAFYDMRLPATPVLRVLVVAPIHSVNLWCQISCKEYPGIRVTVPAERYYLGVVDEVDAFCVWQQFIYSCMLLEPCTVTRAALTTAICGKPESVFPVKTVGHPDEKSNLQPHAICMSTMFDMNDINMVKVVESFEANLKFGVRKILMYDTYNVSELIEAVIKRYENKGLIELIPWQIEPKVDMLFYFGQILQYTDCIYRHMDQFEYLALLDLDDLFIPFYDNTWDNVIGELRKQKTSSYQFFWIQMCVLPNKSKDNFQAGRQDPYIVTHKQSHAIGEERKQIVAPLSILAPHVHHVIRQQWGWAKEYRMPSPEYGLVYHFTDLPSRCQGPASLKLHLTCAHEALIQERVAAVLLEMDLIHKPSFLSQKAEIKPLLTSDILSYKLLIVVTVCALLLFYHYQMHLKKYSKKMIKVFSCHLWNQ